MYHFHTRMLFCFDNLPKKIESTVFFLKHSLLVSTESSLAIAMAVRKCEQHHFDL